VTLVDQDNRRRAMTDFDSLLLVEAAAGTGKTSLMAGRVAMMLASGHVPRDIAAITFTELAASELARRIRHTVDELLTGIVPRFMEAALPEGLSDAQRTSLRNAASRLDDLTATTTHGFCQAIIRSHGVEAGLDPGARIVDAPLADGIFLGELSSWFSRRLADEAVEEEPVAVLAGHLPFKVVDLVGELARLRRKHPDAKPVRPAEDARPDIEFVQAVDDFSRWQTGAGEDRWAREIAAELQTLAARYTNVFASVRDFAALWRLRDPGERRIFAAKSLNLLSYEEAAQVLGAYRDEAKSADALVRYEIVDKSWRNLIGHVASCLAWSLSSSLDDLLRAYRDRKRAAAILDFDDLLIHARSLVRDHEAVRQAIGRRYKYLLVDEFQDTDRVQAEILFSIAAIEHPARWQEARLRPGSLFLVGDPKQAIYRFRGADIEAYHLSRALVVAQNNGAVLEVTANFRSQKAIIDHVNACFHNVFSQPSQPNYAALEATLPEASYDIPCVTRSTIEFDGKVYADNFREAEASKVANICKALIGNLVVTRADNSRSPLRAGDIALLSPSHADIWRYERALEQQELCVSSQAGQTLMRRQETQDILALARVLVDSFDTLAFGALMRGPLIGLSEQELLDITAKLPPSGTDYPSFFAVRTDPSQVQHSLARGVLEDLQTLRKRAASTTPALILSEALERLNARVIMAARHRNRNARALANLDAIIERARPYAVSGLRAFVRDFQADWEQRTKVSEGRIDSAEDAVEIVTMHSAKGLEWPVVIPINSTTELYRSNQFVHRQSDNTLHWVLGGIEPPDLAVARAEESKEEAHQRERIWYVACTRARDLLILPNIPQAAKASWFKAIDLRQEDVPELTFSNLPDTLRNDPAHDRNMQTAEVFAAEQEAVAASAPTLVWRRPSDHDPDRPGDARASAVVVETLGERIEVVGAGAMRGVILHKLMEELLTGELSENAGEVLTRAGALLFQLRTGNEDEQILPDPSEMTGTALLTWGLAEIQAIRPYLVPELAVWAASEDGLVAGRADALAVKDSRVDVVIDWKSDVNVTPTVRAGYMQQLQTYLSATGARRGAVVFMSLGEIAWVEQASAGLPRTVGASDPEKAARGLSG
jgi:CRISPR-associated exonuclease Cas4